MTQKEATEKIVDILTQMSFEDQVSVMWALDSVYRRQMVLLLFGHDFGSKEVKK